MPLASASCLSCFFRWSKYAGTWPKFSCFLGLALATFVTLAFGFGGTGLLGVDPILLDAIDRLMVLDLAPRFR